MFYGFFFTPFDYVDRCDCDSIIDSIVGPWRIAVRARQYALDATRVEWQQLALDADIAVDRSHARSVEQQYLDAVDVYKFYYCCALGQQSVDIVTSAD